VTRGPRPVPERSRSPLAARLSAQLLAGPPARAPAQVVARLLAVQGQDERGFRLAVRVRSEQLSAADVDAALSRGELLVTWLNRGTLHLVRSEDYPWLHALTAPRLRASVTRRLASVGVASGQAERGVRAVAAALRAEGPLARHALRERLQRADVPVDGQRLVYMLALASARGVIVRGPMRDGAHAYVLAEEWLPRARDHGRPAALAELARRYLAGHGPAGERDLARWSGLPLRDARAGFAAIAGEVALWDGHPELLVLAGSERAQPLPAPRLLGAFDPVLLGWCSREQLLGGHAGVVTVNGIFRPFALVRGRAAATWTMPAGEVVLEPLEPLSSRVRSALARDGADVKRFLGR
jgi:hypothetical protein